MEVGFVEFDPGGVGAVGGVVRVVEFEEGGVLLVVLDDGGVGGVETGLQGWGLGWGWNRGLVFFCFSNLLLDD